MYDLVDIIGTWESYPIIVKKSNSKITKMSTFAYALYIAYLQWVRYIWRMA